MKFLIFILTLWLSKAVAVLASAGSEGGLQSSRSAIQKRVTTSLPTSYSTTATYYHNKHRSNHSSPLLSWNPNQAKIAAQIAASCKFQHNMTVNGGGYGQNLAAAGYSGANVKSMNPSLMLAKAITNSWYNNEINKFLPSYYGKTTPDMSNFGAWGHFTQVIWKASTTVGCATQYCPSGTIFPDLASWFTVCNYVARGNFQGLFNTNVLRPKGDPTISV